MNNNKRFPIITLLTIPGLSIGFKVRHWGLGWLNEAGLLSFQLGPLVVEAW